MLIYFTGNFLEQYWVAFNLSLKCYSFLLAISFVPNTYSFTRLFSFISVVEPLYASFCSNVYLVAFMLKCYTAHLFLSFMWSYNYEPLCCRLYSGVLFESWYVSFYLELLWEPWCWTSSSPLCSMLWVALYVSSSSWLICEPFQHNSSSCSFVVELNIVASSAIPFVRDFMPVLSSSLIP